MTTLVLDDPGPGERLAGSARSALTDALRAAARGTEPLVLAVRGDAWSHEHADDDPTTAEGTRRDQHALLLRLHDLRVPVVVHAVGQLRGLGLALALAADARLLGPSASLRVDAAGTRGLLATGLPAVLDLRAGGTAHELLWTGALLSAEQAVVRGLAGAVVPGVDAETEGAAVLDGLASAAASALKRSLVAGRGALLARRLEYDAWLDVAAHPGGAA